jgi:cell division protein FtsW
MARKLKSDRILFVTTLVLVCLGVVMVYSASAALAETRSGNPYLFLLKQVMWVALGIALLAVVMRIDYRTYRQPPFIWSSLGVVSAALIAVLFMPAHNSAHRWFGIGTLGIQPSELAKVVAVIFIAALLELRMHRINDVKYALAPIGAVVLLLVLLIYLEPDLGASATVVLIAGVMVFAAGLNYIYVAGLAASAVAAVAVLIIIAPYRVNRMTAFLDPSADPAGKGYQITQAKYAVATGGVLGRGLMKGVQKLGFLPEPHTDFIYAVISEELGLIGATAVLVCFGVIAWRGVRIALKAQDAFGSFLALGLTTLIAAQAFINMSVVTGLVPNKGLALPFISSGGSSLLVCLVAMGVLLNVSQHASLDS